MKICAIVAMDEGRVIGHQGDIPWNIPGEQKRFAELTRGHAVLMGRKTFDSLPSRYKPLPGRTNIVLTRTPDRLAKFSDVLCWKDVKDCLKACRAGEVAMTGDKLWVIGGEQIYRETQEFWDRVYLTVVSGTHPGIRR